MMEIRSVHQYSLRLVDGSFREGAIIYLKNGGIGDVAPLPGWSHESLAEALAGRPSPAMEAALSMGDSMQVLHEAVPINALLTGNASEILARATQVAGQGCRCVKIKTARVAIAELPGLVRKVSAVLGADASVRIDPNRAWSFDETLHLARSLAGLPVEYLEEPLLNPAALPALIAVSPVPIALDETVREVRLDQLELYAGAATIVIKPTLMGSFAHCRAFADRAGELGLRSVVSGCYESGVGTYALGRFAASLPLMSAAGLDTYSYLEEDVLTRRLEFPGFQFNPNTPMPDVDDSRLVQWP